MDAYMRARRAAFRTGVSLPKTDATSDEDTADALVAEEALDAVAAGEPVLPWEDLKARLDLDD